MSPHKVPISSTTNGFLSCRYQVTESIPATSKELGIPISGQLKRAITCFDQIAAREEFRLDLLVAPGEMTFSNNLITLHRRRAFADDSSGPDKRRLFLRLWLDLDEERARPQALALRAYENDSISEQAGRTPTYAGKPSRGLTAGRTHLPHE